MKKNLVKMLLAVVLAGGATAWIATPQTPDHYEMHVVKGGETMESIIQDSNRSSNVNYDIREAVSIAVSESSKLDNGATSRQLQVGDRVAVPIYRR